MAQKQEMITVSFPRWRFAVCIAVARIIGTIATFSGYSGDFGRLPRVMAAFVLRGARFQ